MLRSIFITLALGQLGGSNTSLSDTLFPKPTGRNGYEEVARAGDLSRRLYLGVYQNWLPPERRPVELPPSNLSKELRELEEALTEKPDPKEIALKQRLENLNQLGVRIEEAKVGSPVIQLVRSGLAKPMARPAIDKGMPGMDEFQKLTSLGRLLVDTVYVQFAQGRPSQAYDDLATGLTLADRISPFGTMSLLAATSISSRTFGGFEQHLERIPLAELRDIPTFTQTLLKRNRLLEAYAYDQQADQKRFEDLAREILCAAGKDDGDDGGDEVVSAIIRQMRRMTPAQKANFTTELKKRVRDQYVALLESLKGPESTWIGEKVVVPEQEQKVSSISDVLDVLASWSTPNKRQITVSYVRIRTQLRLLDLHSRVLAFRWTHGRLPRQLGELDLSGEATFDHLSKQPFVYESLNDRDYRLFSKGTADTGEVFLKYTRPPQQNATDRP
jgi:hypothetical protein